MKKYPKTATKPYQTSLQTDIQDSYPFYSCKKTKESQIKRKKSSRNSIKNKQQLYPKKILRFSLNHLKRTLRIPCYNEESLNLPIRFTKKLNNMEVDNDVDTDEEVVDHEINRCCDWLKEAIKTNKQEHKERNE